MNLSQHIPVTKDISKHVRLLETWQAQSVVRDQPWAGRSVLIIGAMGLVGICCLQTWLDAGADVVALTRRAEPPFNHPRLTWLAGDLTDAESWAMWKTLPETVVVCAPIWVVASVIPTFATLGVKRLIAFSSTSVHTKADSGKDKERALAATLQKGERDVFAAATAGGIAATILRPTLIYGIGLDFNIASLARVMRKLPFFPIPFGANGLRQPVHAMDLGRATLQVALHPESAGRAYDVGGGERLPYRVMLQRIATAMQKKILLLPVPAFARMMDVGGMLLRRSYHSHGEVIRRMQKDMVFDDSAARNDFDWNPRGFLDVSKQPDQTPFF